MSRLDDLYARYLTPLTMTVIGFGTSEDDAKDIAQETLIATWKRLEHVAPEAEWAYLRVAARHRYLRRIEQHGRQQPLEPAHDAPDKAPSPETEVIEKEEAALFHERFKAAMRELPSDTRQAVVLRSRGLGSKEIAQKLGLTDQAVRTRLSRAFELIRERVGTPPAGVAWMRLPGDHDDHEK